MFKKILIALSVVLAFAANAGTKVLLSTNLGNIEVELNDEKAPVSTKNFLSYVESGFYTDTIFHRVIPGFMIQGGGFTADLNQKPTQPPIKNEAENGLKNSRGTIAMARTNDINSATSQFYINVVDNPFLDNSGQNFGYAVFGKVTNGMDVVDKIVAVPTHRSGPHANVPSDPITILSAKIVQ